MTQRNDFSNLLPIKQQLDKLSSILITPTQHTGEYLSISAAISNISDVLNKVMKPSEEKADHFDQLNNSLSNTITLNNLHNDSIPNILIQLDTFVKNKTQHLNESEKKAYNSVLDELNKLSTALEQLSWTKTQEDLMECLFDDLRVIEPRLSKLLSNLEVLIKRYDTIHRRNNSHYIALSSGTNFVEFKTNFIGCLSILGAFFSTATAPRKPSMDKIDNMIFSAVRPKNLENIYNNSLPNFITLLDRFLSTQENYLNAQDKELCQTALSQLNKLLPALGQLPWIKNQNKTEKEESTRLTMKI